MAQATGVVLGLGTVYGLVRNWWVVAKIAISVAVVVTDAVLVVDAHDRLRLANPAAAAIVFTRATGGWIMTG